MNPTHRHIEGKLWPLPIMEEPIALNYQYEYGGAGSFENDYQTYLLYLKTVLPIEGKHEWKDGQELTEGVDFEKRYLGAEEHRNGEYKDRTVAIPIIKQQEEESWLPPDHGEICWAVGAETFSRKEVYYLLWTQRAMIINDMKRAVSLSREAIEVLNNPRVPKY